MPKNNILKIRKIHSLEIFLSEKQPEMTKKGPKMVILLDL